MAVQHNVQTMNANRMLNEMGNQTTSYAAGLLVFTIKSFMHGRATPDLLFLTT